MTARPFFRARPRCRRTRGLARLHKARGGTAAVELALLLPAFLTFLLGIVEFGRLFWTQSALQFAVEAAARCAAVNTTTCNGTTATQNYAASQVFGITVPSASFTVSQPSCGNEVSISYAFTFVAPTLLPWTVSLNAQSCHP